MAHGYATGVFSSPDVRLRLTADLRKVVAKAKSLKRELRVLGTRLTMTWNTLDHE